MAKSRTVADEVTFDAIEMLEQDHRKVEALFAEFEDSDDKREQRRIARQICAELDVHARLEEQLFYPEAKQEVKDVKSDINEGIVEHQAVKRLVLEISRMSAGDEFFEPKVTVLKEFVEHHVKEEENEIFPRLREEGLDVQDLGRRMAQRKPRLLRQAAKRYGISSQARGRDAGMPAQALRHA